MKLVKALRLKNTLVKEISNLKNKIGGYNSINVKVDSPWDVKQVIAEYEVKTQKLIELKTKIAQANSPIYHLIYKLDELKAQIAFWNGVSCINGRVLKERYDEVDKEDEFRATINESEREKMVQEFTTTFEKIQEELSDFNYNTSIDLNW